MHVITNRTRKILINVGGFGLGLLWVLHDEMDNPKIFRIPTAGQFSDEELVTWNQNTGPKGPWAVGEEEVRRMHNQHFVKDEASVNPTRW